MLVPALVLAPLAYGIVLPPDTNPLRGSNFQGADGNHDDASPYVDWQTYRRAGRVLHSGDPNAQDSAFTGGSKENEPGRWGLTTEADGVRPGKANIYDAWTAADLGGPNAFGYLGFTRGGTSGATSYVAFELNHDSRLWWNGRATIPCRRSGDLLLSYHAREDYDAELVLQRWLPIQTDLATGCSTEGRLDDLTLRPNNVQGAVNDSEITSRLPVTDFFGDTVPAGRFGEAALNMSQILGSALGNPCFAFSSVWMHTRSSVQEDSNMQDIVAPRRINIRSCAASGLKFHDLNGNGRRDRREPGLSNWIMWADYDNDGVRDGDEPFAFTDARGRYVINGIRPPRGTYWIREMLPTAAARRRAAAADVFCSFPNATTPGGTGSAPGGQFPCAWGPITSASTSWARRRNFGNFEAARLTVRKELFPRNDLGRFDLLVNGRVVIASAGNGASHTLTGLRPGAYTVSEVAAAGTNAANYTSTPDCKIGAARTRRGVGISQTIQLNSGQAATCTFTNVLHGRPGIAIDKSGPATATAGDTLHYTLEVTNPGDLPFPAASVRVTDPNCDEAPELVGKSDGSGADNTPRTLDPGDIWTFSCSKKTSAPADCQPSVVPNTATISGTAGGETVTDSSTINTQLECPPPPEPPPPPPGPEPPPPPPPPPTPIEPPGPVLPDADGAGTAGVLFRRVTTGCIPPGRVPRVVFAGTRVASVRVYVNGRLDRRLTVRSLQTRLRPRVLGRPGARLRLRVVVTFQRGTGSPPVTLRARVEICAVRRGRPSFTG